MLFPPSRRARVAHRIPSLLERYLTAAAVAGLALCPAATRAQAPQERTVAIPPATARASARPQFQPLLPLLRALSDGDASVRGPLFLVGPPPVIAPVAEKRAALPTIARAMQRRVVSAESVTTLVPHTMTVINTRPGKANPFSGMRASEVLKLLLASFTPEQWQKAGSAGIGAAEMTDDQRLLWDAILPLRLQVQKNTVRTGKEPGSLEYVNTGLVDIKDRAGIRLRLNKQVSYSFSKQGAEDYSWGGSPYNTNDVDGDVRYHLMNYTEQPDGTITANSGFERSDTKLPNSAYGVQLLTEQPRRLKEGAVDFAASSLNARVSLTDFPVKPLPNIAIPPGTPPEAEIWRRAEAELKTLPTVGDLLARITQATKWEFVADQRVRDLPVFLSGDSARAGDLLMALAWGVAGAYRKMEPGGAGDTAPLYLLTDDVEGIGTRVARLAEWGQDGDEAKRRMMEGAQERTAKNNPLAYLGFASGDKFALSEAQAKKAEDGWRRKKYAEAPEIIWADLPPALQTSVREFANERQKEGVPLRTDRIRVNEELTASLVIPEMDIVLPAQDLAQGLGGQYLQEIAYDPAKKAEPAEKPAAPKKPAPLGFAASQLKAQRRVLIARPSDVVEAQEIVRAAAKAGITDVWLEVGLNDPEASARLLARATRAAQATGGKVTVGGSVRLLKDSGVSGEVERTIFGETGEHFRERMLRHYDPDKKDLWTQRNFSNYAGWVVPDTADLTARLKKLVDGAPGLSGLTIRASGAPGWTGMKSGGDGIWMNGALGYTPAMRRAFLRAYGVDPVDIPDQRWALREISWNLGYFKESDGRGEYHVVDGKVVFGGSDEVPSLAWWAFRKRKNDQMLTDLFQVLKKDRPTLSLYIDNRISGYTHANTDWFGSWDVANKLPDSGVFSVESEIRADARRTSKTIFAHWGHWWTDTDATKPDSPAKYARSVTDAALRNAPPAWNGLVLDMTGSGMTGAMVVRLLQGLPPATAR